AGVAEQLRQHVLDAVSEAPGVQALVLGLHLQLLVGDPRQVFRPEGVGTFDRQAVMKAIGPPLTGRRRIRRPRRPRRAAAGVSPPAPRACAPCPPDTPGSRRTP